MVGVGVDLCGVSRMGAALQRTPGLSDRLFTAPERASIGRRPHAAARVFAVKEAVMKSLGAGFDIVPFAAIEVDLSGPEVELRGEAALRAELVGARSLHVELSVIDGPQGPVAVAEVLALG